MGKPVMYFEILGEEPEKLYPFYAKMFDWEINADNPMNYGYINTGTEKGIQGGIGHARFTGQKKVMFYVEVEDLQASLDEAVEMGGKVLIPPTEIMGFSFATFEDPAGNPVGIILGRDRG